MAATDPDQRAHTNPVAPRTLSDDALESRLDEEVMRAERHGTRLSCLLVRIDDLDEMEREHGAELSRETVEYVAAALRGELRSFDRVGQPNEGELLVVLPGTDSQLGEIVARRLLERLRTIKVEAGGTRRPLQVSVGLAAWSAQMSAGELLGRARAAAQRMNGEEQSRGHEPHRPAP